jgi:hypothetical protein
VDTPADEPVVVQGRLYTLQLSARDNQTTIKDIRKVYRVLGVTKFLDLCTITLKAIKESVNPKVYEGLVETHRTGFRTLKTVLRAPAKQGIEAA